jgi:O-methyltransferase involved in polyketide biosynthesis
MTATQRPKSAAFGLVGNLTLVPVDFAHTLSSPSLLAHPRFDARRRTCVVAEGFLMYFPRDRVAEILSDLIQLPAGKVIFTFMAPGPDGHAAFRGGSAIIDAWLRFRREPFAWAIAPEHLENFLRPLGLNLRALAGSAELREKILAPAGLASTPLAEGEHLCLATAP